MKVVKITVLETSLRKDLAEEYAVPGLEACPVLKAGQVFRATNTCPKGMCDAAWRTINQYVFALACGVREFYGGGWMKWNHPKMSAAPATPRWTMASEISRTSSSVRSVPLPETRILSMFAAT